MTAPKRVVLEVAIEDYYGLWELIWRLRDSLAGASGPEVQNAAEDAVRDLLQRGWIQLYRRVGVSGPATPVPTEEVGATLSDARSWKEPLNPDALCILVAATSAGEEAYYSNEL